MLFYFLGCIYTSVPKGIRVLRLATNASFPERLDMDPDLAEAIFLAEACACPVISPIALDNAASDATSPNYFSFPAYSAG
ncbi:hypothetical protein [Elizabethkingia meningoseptica]|uniref:hypothetical protein n=1 Tax=Elizabethkingia meningoseptica TaxID=238 RepID=UPI0023AF5860|nr:hypothetical protein [Elizabethkingia meningoseptica]